MHVPLQDTTKDPQHALQLSGQLLRVNPDVYSLWNHRKEIIVATKEIIEPGEQVRHEWSCVRVYTNKEA